MFRRFLSAGGLCSFEAHVDKAEARFFFLALKTIVNAPPNAAVGDMAQHILEEVKREAMEDGKFDNIECVASSQMRGPDSFALTSFPTDS